MFGHIQKPKVVRVTYAVRVPADIPLMVEQIRQFKGFPNPEAAVTYAIRTIWSQEIQPVIPNQEAKV